MGATSNIIGEMQLDGLVEAVHGIYSSKDAKRSLWDVWMHTSHHASAIGEEVRKGSAAKLLSDIADCAMWLFTMVQKLQGPVGSPKPPNDSPQESLIRVASSYSEMLWSRYPGICPLCYWRRTGGDRAEENRPGFKNPCDCLCHDTPERDTSQRQLHVATLRAFSQNAAASKPTSVDKWQEMFSTIFAANLRRLELSDIAFHLLEEMGEASDALIRMYTYKDTNFVVGEPRRRQIQLEDQLSDVSSWIFALAAKLDLLRRSEAERTDCLKGGEKSNVERLLLSQIIWSRYRCDEPGKFACWSCRMPNCVCKVVLVPPDRSVDELRGLIESAKG
jgi:NTP pyrophosphatase (non-canonical NTP hydrolase)